MGSLFASFFKIFSAVFLCSVFLTPTLSHAGKLEDQLRAAMKTDVEKVRAIHGDAAALRLQQKYTGKGGFLERARALDDAATATGINQAAATALMGEKTRAFENAKTLQKAEAEHAEQRDQKEALASDMQQAGAEKGAEEARTSAQESDSQCQNCKKNGGILKKLLPIAAIAALAMLASGGGDDEEPVAAEAPDVDTDEAPPAPDTELTPPTVAETGTVNPGGTSDDDNDDNKNVEDGDGIGASTFVQVADGTQTIGGSSTNGEDGDGAVTLDATKFANVNGNMDELISAKGEDAVIQGSSRTGDTSIASNGGSSNGGSSNSFGDTSASADGSGDANGSSRGDTTDGEVDPSTVAGTSSGGGAAFALASYSSPDKKDKKDAYDDGIEARKENGLMAAIKSLSPEELKALEEEEMKKAKLKKVARSLASFQDTTKPVKKFNPCEKDPKGYACGVLKQKARFEQNKKRAKLKEKGLI